MFIRKMKYIGIDCPIVCIISTQIITFSKMRIYENTIVSSFLTKNLKSFHSIERYFLFCAIYCFQRFSTCTISPDFVYPESTPGVSKNNRKAELSFFQSNCCSVKKKVTNSLFGINFSWTTVASNNVQLSFRAINKPYS